MNYRFASLTNFDRPVTHRYEAHAEHRGCRIRVATRYSGPSDSWAVDIHVSSTGEELHADRIRRYDKVSALVLEHTIRASFILAEEEIDRRAAG